MVKAIIFDCYGVLVTESYLAFKAKYFGDDQDKYDEAARLMDLNNEGRLDFSQFLVMIGEMAGLTAQQVLHELDGNSPNIELFNYINELKKDYQLGVLSNIGTGVLEQLLTEDQIALFDVLALSSEMGVIKPYKEIYLQTAAMLEVDPNQCLFIDDRQGNVDGAIQAGMQSIRYVSFDQVKSDIESLLNSDN